MSAELYQQFRDTFGVEIINSKGSAESYLGYIVDRPGEVVPGAAGKLTSFVEARLVDGEGRGRGKRGDGRSVGPVRGVELVLPPGPRKDENGTFLGNDWINTNDLFHEDENGYFCTRGARTT
jgi:acyl-coenzyme A synthetase/AMP-(fatty) acid ligase